MSVRSRRSRVAACLALITQWLTVRRYEGGCASNQARARASRRSTVAEAASSSRGDSNEYGAGPLWRRSNAARPAGFMLPAAVSSPARRMFTALQMLFVLRGVNRYLKRFSSTPFRIPSIQPQQSASSSASR